MKDEGKPTHSRATGAVRLLLALWLMLTALRTLADPRQAVADQGQPLGVLLPLAGVSFTLGVFLLTGFMSRVAGLILLCLGVWEWITLGAGAGPALLAVVGVYFMLRGGGAWAMDIYVQKVQDRARRKAALNAPQSS
ncbi:MAG: hypothetical protein M3069_14970 [Chloroflexota bacterium]|nr:hypothetical protein [Chloroflexota bacterium]